MNPSFFIYFAVQFGTIESQIGEDQTQFGQHKNQSDKSNISGLSQISSSGGISLWTTNIESNVTVSKH